MTRETGEPGEAIAALESSPTLTTRASTITVEEASAIAAKEYGLTGSITRLSGERDQNFRVDDPVSGSWAMKIVHPAEERSITNFQTAIILHLAERDPGLPVPRILRTQTGQADKLIRLSDGSTRMMRTIAFLSGTILRGCNPSENRNKALGRVLARMQIALSDLRHEAENHRIAWDLSNTLWQRGIVPGIENPQRRGLMEAGLDRFERKVVNRLKELRTQVIHGDLNGDNVLVSATNNDDVLGVIDFGDAVRTAGINDIAVAMAYSLLDTGDDLKSSAAFISGFSSLLPLRRVELDVLLELIIARLVIRVGITEWRARRFPENREYILRTTEANWSVLAHVLQIPCDAARSMFYRAAGCE